MEEHRNILDASQINAIGGLRLAEVRRLIFDYAEGLAEESVVLRSLASRRRVAELQERLRRIRGAALTTGFVLIARTAGEWLDDSDPLALQWFERFDAAVSRSVSEWRSMSR